MATEKSSAEAGLLTMLTPLSAKPTIEIIEEAQRYRKLQYKWFTCLETGDEYKLVYFAHDNDGKLNVVLSHVRLNDLKRVMYYKTFFRTFKSKDGDVQALMVPPKEGVD